MCHFFPASMLTATLYSYSRKEEIVLYLFPRSLTIWRQVKFTQIERMWKIAFNKSTGDIGVTPLFSYISFYSPNSFRGPRPQPLPSLTSLSEKPPLSCSYKLFFILPFPDFRSPLLLCQMSVFWPSQVPWVSNPGGSRWEEKKETLVDCTQVVESTK